MKKLLIPYDFSESSESILQYGLGLAKDLSAAVSLLHVTPYPVVTPEAGLPMYSYKEVLEDTKQALQKIAERIRHKAPGTTVADCIVEMGDVSESIVEHCKKDTFEFVVMGINQHGTRLMKTLLGSNAVETAHKTRCTVIIVPPGFDYKKPKNIVVASEQNEENNPTLQKAKQISALFQAELQVLRVVPQDHHFAPSEVVIDNHFGSRHEKIPHKHFIITEKKVSEGLLGMLDNRMTDMILIEPKEHGVFYKMFHESVSKEVAFASPVPVMLIHS